MRNFRTYHVWQDSIDLVTKVYKLTESIPAEEIYSLTKQIKRSAISIPSNFAEGCSRESEKELKHFIEVALGSAFELETQLIIANNLFVVKNVPLYEEIFQHLSKIQAKRILANSACLPAGRNSERQCLKRFFLRKKLLV